MNLTFTPSAWNDYQWFQQHDRKLLMRWSRLIVYGPRRMKLVIDVLGQSLAGVRPHVFTA